MRARVSGFTKVLALSARDTVDTETPASRAMSAICTRDGVRVVALALLTTGGLMAGTAAGGLDLGIGTIGSGVAAVAWVSLCGAFVLLWVGNDCVMAEQHPASGPAVIDCVFPPNRRLGAAPGRLSYRPVRVTGIVQASLKETTGRSRVFLTPSGGLTRSGRFGGTHEPAEPAALWQPPPRGKKAEAWTLVFGTG